MFHAPQLCPRAPHCAASAAAAAAGSVDSDSAVSVNSADGTRTAQAGEKLFPELAAAATATPSHCRSPKRCVLKKPKRCDATRHDARRDETRRSDGAHEARQTNVGKGTRGDCDSLGNQVVIFVPSCRRANVPSCLMPSCRRVCRVRCLCLCLCRCHCLGCSHCCC